MARGSTPTPEGVDDIVSASSKDEEWSNSDVLETCASVASLREQNHGSQSTILACINSFTLYFMQAGKVIPGVPVEASPRG